MIGVGELNRTSFAEPGLDRVVAGMDQTMSLIVVAADNTLIVRIIPWVLIWGWFIGSG